MNMMESNLNEDDVKKIVQRELKFSFNQKRIGDTPTDALQLTPRKYVNMYGSILGRPTGSIVGQFYFDTTIGRPVYWNGRTFVDGAGSVS